MLEVKRYRCPVHGDEMVEDVGGEWVSDDDYMVAMKAVEMATEMLNITNDMINIMSVKDGCLSEFIELNLKLKRLKENYD